MKLDRLRLKQGGEEGESKETGLREMDERALELVEKIEEMVGDGRWEWAYTTLTEIQDAVRKWGRITLGQRRAVENIWNAREKDEEILWKH